MSHSVQMPALGESVTEGTVTRWLKKVGDAVAEDEPLLEVSTDKVDTEVPAPYAGVLEQILVQEDETVGIGAVLAVIGDGSGAATPAAAVTEEPVPPAAVAAAVPTPVAGLPETPAPAAVAPVSEVPAVSAAAPSAPPAPQAGTTVVMPAMGESVTEGTVTRWLKAVGDAVAEDEALVEISTDKVDAEVPSPVAGTLLQILAGEDATVGVGAPIAIVGSGAAAPAPEAEPVSVPPAPAAPAHAAPAAPVAEAPAPQAAPPSSGSLGSYVTPVVRKLAADHGVDLSRLAGSGVGGRIRREDVLAAAAGATPSATPAATAPTEPAAAPAAPQPAAAPPPAPAAPQPAAAPAAPLSVTPTPVPVATAPQQLRTADLVGTVQPAPRIRQAIARSMMHAVSSSAQTTTIIEVDATRVAALLGRVQDTFRGREGGELTLVPFFVKAAIEAAKAHPVINASLADDLSEITYHAAVHVGVAVDTDRGQVTPVIHRADDLNVAGLARHLLDLTDRTERGALSPDELSGATITVTNVGTPGVLIDTPIVVPPQAATLALGSVTKRPVVVTDAEGNDVIAIRSIATLALSFDQRFVDGAEASRYLATIRGRIEDGDFVADLGI